MKNRLLLLLLLTGSGSDAHVITDEIMTVWGYETNPRTAYLSDFCVGSITPLSAEYQGIRAINNEQNQGKVRHRFTLGKEVYQSIGQAKMSTTEINNPSTRSSKHAKMCDLRQAFNLDNVVYFVHTDVGSIKPEISHIMDKLHRFLLESQLESK